MLAKVISHDESRELAAAKLRKELENCHFGGFVNNIDFLINILGNESFLNGETTTDFIARYNPPRSIEIDSNEMSFYQWQPHCGYNIKTDPMPLFWATFHLAGTMQDFHINRLHLNWMKQNSQSDTKGRETAHLLMRKIRLPSSIMSQMNLLILNLIS